MGLFGKPAQRVEQPVYQRPPVQAAAPSVDQALNTAAMREGHLEARIQRIENDISNYKREMQRCRPGTTSHNTAKRRAMNALKQKKALEAQLASVSNSTYNLEAVKDVREQVQFQQEQAQAIQASHKELVAQQQKVDVDQIEELQDEITDTMADVHDVSEALGRTYEVEPVDESELLAELDGLEEQDFASVSSAAAPTPTYLNPAPVPGSQQAYAPQAYLQQHQQAPARRV